MLTCKDTAVLLSKGMDEKLSFFKRIALFIHLYMCRSCNNYNNQLQEIKRISVKYIENSKNTIFLKVNISNNAKNRIKENVEKYFNN